MITDEARGEVSRFARRYASVPESVGAARRAVRGALVAQGYGEEVTQLAVLLASELATNAVVYAQSASFTVRCWLQDSLVSIGVIDSDTANLPHRTEAGDQDENGRGLALVETLADDWGCVPCAGGKLVFASLNIAQPQLTPACGGRLAH